MTTIAIGGWRGDDKTNAAGPPKKPKPAGGNQVNIAKPTNNNTLSNRQTQGNYNYNQAMAHYQGDPRYAGKQYQRAGMSSSAGTNYLGSAQAANQYAQNMAAAEAGRMQDAYSNADITLNDAAQRSQFGLALTGLQEDAAQREYMNQLRNQQNAMNAMGNMMSSFGGGGPSSLLSGLL
jgi:hypothetical protein